MTWSPDSVKQELVRAFEVLWTLPDNDRMSTGRGFWPHHTYEADEVDEMRKASITEGEGRQRVRFTPKDIQRMEQVLLGEGGQANWLYRFLRDAPGARRCLVCWAIWMSRGVSERAGCRRRGWAQTTFRRRREEGAVLLADALNSAGVELA